MRSAFDSGQHRAGRRRRLPEWLESARTASAFRLRRRLGWKPRATTAIMLGGLMMWGLRPGPLLFEKNPEFVWGLIASQYIANVMLLILSTAFIPLFVRALRVPYGILMPIIIVLCVTGAYSLKNSVFDDFRSAHARGLAGGGGAAAARDRACDRSASARPSGPRGRLSAFRACPSSTPEGGRSRRNAWPWHRAMAACAADLRTRFTASR